MLVTVGVLATGVCLLVAKIKGVTLADLSPATITRSLTPKTLSPEESIYAMLDAAKAGDIRWYLSSYTGRLREMLNQLIVETTPARFEQYLRSSNAAILGVAISPPETQGSSQVKVRVEYVCRDRNEVQFLYLQKEDSGWKVYRVDAAERIKTPVPYGSAVTD